MPLSTITAWLQNNYGFTGALEISLLRSYTNDVYRIGVSEEQYVLKIYGLNWRTEEDIQYEIELLNHLEKRGLTVAKPVRGTHNEPLKRIPTYLGAQWAVLFEYAAGQKPEPPFSSQLYFHFGAAIGRMHELSTTFATGHRRKSIDIEYLIDQPLQIILPFIRDRSLESVYIRALGNKIRDRINRLQDKGLDWGPIHGDATLDNLHIGENQQIILYDFDSGGPGWRASDMQGWAAGSDEYQEKYEQFLNGYRLARIVKEQDIEASWYLTLAWDIWGMKIDVENRVMKLGEAAVNQFLAEKIEQIRDREIRIIRA